MTLATCDDFLNPKFVFFSPVQDIPPGTRQLEEHVDRAIIALDGLAPIGGDWSIEQLNPVLAGRAIRVELWVNDIDDYTCTYGFLASSEDGRVPYARGERVVVCIDPSSRNPSKWSNAFRISHAELLKDLPAYA
ncbi:MAG TPA: thioesterase family protein [Thermoanaerobaculia bacterium]|nr:thioesterase family protein [Thermoanaerobaculia bacterium]